jgi:predicted metal-dependent hydrolase
MAIRWMNFLVPSADRAAKRRAAEPASYFLVVDGRDVLVTLRRHASARRFTLRLTPKGDAATVTMPKSGSAAEARAFVERHRGWLAERLGPPTISATGMCIPVRGVPHVVRPSGSLRGTVCIVRDLDGAAALLVPGAPEHLPRRVGDYLRNLAREDLAAAVARHAATLGVRPKAIRLKDTTSRWGSASSAGTLSFSWRLAMAPPFVLDYLAAHEVAHLREMNHSERFWAICEALAPRTAEARDWLKKHGRDLHRVL